MYKKMIIEAFILGIVTILSGVLFIWKIIEVINTVKLRQYF